ncbi:hypothetical protein [Sphaerisporangium perillae]|uniref:hypothetical protein n=1 Tax=Sphaerisporangium perillae TaxID=2935860 RepID=UPI00200D6C71|nr:hypothetical protein [Sphaerisporangium perillae]
MDPVRAHHQVERARGTALERDVHAARGLGERGDGVAEDVPASGGGGLLVQQPGQVTARDLDLAAGELAGEHREPAAVRADDLLVGAAGLQPQHLAEDAHALQHGAVDRALEVDGLPARARGGSLLDDGHVEAVAVEPVGESGAADAGAGDEDVGVLHVHEPRRER